jgi:hypothetical protein
MRSWQKLRLVAPVASAAIMPLVWSSALSVKLSLWVFPRPGTRKREVQLAAQRRTDAGARDRAGVSRRGVGRSGRTRAANATRATAAMRKQAGDEVSVIGSIMVSACYIQTAPKGE